MQFYEEAFSFYRLTSFQPAWGPPFIVLLNHYAMICSFSLSAVLHRAPPVRRITSRLTMEISLHAFIVQFNPQPFVSLCILCPSYKSAYLLKRQLSVSYEQMSTSLTNVSGYITYQSRGGRSSSALSSDRRRL